VVAPGWPRGPEESLQRQTFRNVNILSN
jgi:hypothetical protein